MNKRERTQAARLNAAQELQTIINEAGCEVDYDAAVAIMDDAIREELSAELAPCTQQEFFAAYCDAHRAKFGEEFAPNTKNAAW